jgi:cytochrome c oxidase subunit 2
MRAQKDVQAKVARTNKIRGERAARGEENSDPWEFDYILLCNKICGKSHYNMQMKIIVEDEASYNKWLASQKTFGQQMAAN